MPEEEAEQAAADRNATVFDTPTPRWSTGLTIPVSFLDKLGVVDRAVLVDATYMTNACMQLAIEDDSDLSADCRGAVMLTSRTSMLPFAALLVAASSGGCACPPSPCRRRAA